MKVTFYNVRENSLNQNSADQISIIDVGDLNFPLVPAM